jgi:hypothetical protein
MREAGIDLESAKKAASRNGVVNPHLSRHQYQAQ